MTCDTIEAVETTYVAMQVMLQLSRQPSKAYYDDVAAYCVLRIAYRLRTHSLPCHHFFCALARNEAVRLSFINMLLALSESSSSITKHLRLYDEIDG